MHIASLANYHTVIRFSQKNSKSTGIAERKNSFIFHYDYEAPPKANHLIILLCVSSFRIAVAKL